MLNGFDGWASTNIEVNDEGEGYDQASGSELNTLSHLNVLEMDVSNAEQMLTINNSQLVEQLGKFKIRVGDYFACYKPKGNVYLYDLELNEIDPSQNNWLRALLKKTDRLIVNKCPSFAVSFIPLFEGDGFNDLKCLGVSQCEFKFIIDSKEHDKSMIFANLEVLLLLDMRSLEMICDGKAPSGMFSNLRQLYLNDLCNLKCGLPLALVPLNLSSVAVFYCPSLETIFNKEASVSENEANIVPFPLLKSLQLKGVEKLSNVLRQSHCEISTIEGVSLDLFDSKSIFPSLEELTLVKNLRFMRLWSNACDPSGFQNLKALRIDCCHELLSLGSPSMFAALVQLEKLEISSCPRLREVVTKETEGQEDCKHIIGFPLLKRLSLDDLPILERFYGGGYKLEFPNLKSMSLIRIGEGSENSTTFFSDKIEYPCLEKLEVWNVWNEVGRLLLNWTSSDVRGESETSISSLNPLPNLQMLTVGRIDGLISIPPFISHKLSHLRVRDFYETRTLFSALASNREIFGTYSEFPNLKNLSVFNCYSLEQLFENEDDTGALIFCEQIIGITLEVMPRLKILPLHLFKNIQTLTLEDLFWEYVFSADLFIRGSEQLQQLEDLSIGWCSRMKVIIKDTLDRDGEDDRVYSFPKLKNLNFSSLNITSFASNSSIALHFPSLETILIENCDELGSFFSGPFLAPKLKLVWLRACDNLRYVVSEKLNDIRELPSLETVEVESCGRLLSFSSEALVVPKLHSVTLNGCYQMVWFLTGEHTHTLDLPCLESVSIEQCWEMLRFSSGGINAPNLYKVTVDAKDYSKSANEELQDILVNLSMFHIRSGVFCVDEQKYSSSGGDGSTHWEAI